MNEKVMICVLGNMATGKTSTAELLMKVLTNYKYIGIDEYRNKFNYMNTIHGENVVYEILIKDVRAYDYVILEMTGTSKSYWQVEEAFLQKGGHIFRLILDGPEWLLKKRYEARKEGGFVQMFPYKMNLEKSLKYIATKIQRINADLRLDTGVHNPSQVVNRLLSEQIIQRAIALNDIAGATNAKVFEPIAEKFKHYHRECPDGMIKIETVIRLLQEGMNDNDTGFFSIEFVKKDGSLRYAPQITRAGKAFHIDRQTGRVLAVDNEKASIQRVLYYDNHIFIFDYETNKTIRLILNRILKFNNLPVFH